LDKKRIMKLDEKAVSVAQRRLFGIALAVKRGDKSIGDFEEKDAIRQLMKLPDKELKKFAKTKEKDLPQKVAKEALFQELRKFAGLTEGKRINRTQALKDFNVILDTTKKLIKVLKPALGSKRVGTWEKDITKVLADLDDLIDIAARGEK